MRTKINESGEIKLPEEFLQEIEIKKDRIVNIDIDYCLDEIIIKKVYPGCVFCNNGFDIVRINDKYICVHCIDILKNAKIGDNFCVAKVN